MKNFKIQIWKKIEKEFKKFPILQYRYPGSTLPKKDSKEGINLKKFLPKINKGIFLDYGCGEGAMLKYIKNYYGHFPSLIVAIDPDYFRLIKAKKWLLEHGGKGVFFNATFDNLIFRQKKLQNSLSCIICIQVFGHISESSLMNSFETFSFLLEPNGILIIAVPFVNGDFCFPNWERGRDFFCLVNCSKRRVPPKIVVTRQTFSNFAKQPKLYWLPTRRFYINIETKINHICDLEKITNSKLGKYAARFGFVVEKALVYKLKSEKGSGDLMISFSLKK